MVRNSALLATILEPLSKMELFSSKKRSETAPPWLMDRLRFQGWSCFGLHKVINCATGGTKMVQLGKGELEQCHLQKGGAKMDPLTMVELFRTFFQAGGGTKIVPLSLKWSRFQPFFGKFGKTAIPLDPFWKMVPLQRVEPFFFLNMIIKGKKRLHPSMWHRFPKRLHPGLHFFLSVPFQRGPSVILLLLASCQLYLTMSSDPPQV